MQQCTLVLCGSALKRAGQALALDRAGNAWTERTVDALRAFCANLKLSGNDNPEFTMEEFRATRAHDLPVSPKCWGAFTSSAARHGIIMSTDRYQKAKSLKTHAHPILIWRAL